MSICGGGAAAKKTGVSGAEAVGFEPVDAAPLSQARLLESLAMLWISVAMAYAYGTGIAFKLLRAWWSGGASM
jgi:predicted dinucleotide-binding enzyme